jgi:hypothetical protein
MNTALGFVGWHWRSGWSTVSLILLVAILVVVVAIVGGRSGKGDSS